MGVTHALVSQHMETVSTLAFHPVKMQGCYQKVEQLSLEGLQQRFDVSSPSVFVQRAQILMRQVSWTPFCPPLGLQLSVAMVTLISQAVMKVFVREAVFYCLRAVHANATRHSWPSRRRAKRHSCSSLGPFDLTRQEPLRLVNLAR